MAFNEKEQAVIRWGLENGKTKQEVTDAITKLRTGATGITPERTQVVEKPSQMSRLGTDLLNRAKTVGEQVKQVGEAEGAVETGAQIAQTPLRVAGQAAGAVGDIIGAGVNAATGGGLDKLGEYIASTETGKQLGASLLKLQQEQPELAGTLGDLFNIATVGVGGTAAKPVVKAIGTGAKNAIEAVGDITKLVPDNLGQKAVDIISSDPSAKVETILKRSTPEEVDNFLNIAKQSSVSGEAKSVFEVVGDKLSDTTKILQTKLNEIGKAKSEIMQPLRAGFDSFKKETTPFIQKLNSLKNSFTEIDAASKAKVQAIINDAKNVVTKQDADVLIDKVQDALYKGGVDMTIPKGSALDKQLRGILGEYNTALKNSLPKEYGQLNAQYSKLVESLDTINRSLGEVVEGVPVRGASLIKQYFSPAGSKAKEIFEFIKKETNGQVDLAKDATLAKFAGELYDDANVSSLLGGLKSLPTTVGGIATKIVEKLGGERVSNAMRESTARKAKTKAQATKKLNSLPKEKGIIGTAIDNLKDPKMRQGGYIRNPLAKKELPVQKSSSLNNTTDLIQEAKKYKTAEEFVKAQPTYYHGTQADFSSFDTAKTGAATDSGLLGRGVYFTPNKAQALDYANAPYKTSGGTPRIVEATVNLKKPIVIESGVLPDGRGLSSIHPNGITKSTSAAIEKELKAQGYDGAIFKTDGYVTQIMSFDPKNVLTKSQLEEIWNKAQGTLPKKQK